jgi:hypothetical protein
MDKKAKSPPSLSLSLSLSSSPRLKTRHYKNNHLFAEFKNKTKKNTKREIHES